MPDVASSVLTPLRFLERSAQVWADRPAVVSGCADPKAGACHTLFRITEDDRLNHRCRVIGGVLADSAAGILRRFFLDRRAEGKK